ncbi:MAG: hypothetical protein IKV85_05405 [Ruminococcus sp.]|nr:hypothetical protein [Ruminococcus sp.]
MAKKATAAKAAEVKEEVKAVEAVVEAVTEAAPVEEAPKKTAAKKTAAKKTPAKKPAVKKTAEKKPVEKKTSTRKTAPKTNLFIQYQGAELSYADLIERAKIDSGVEAPKNINLYVKPEDNMVYYVVDEKVGGFVIA